MYEVDAFTPVINLPEAAILGVGRIAAKAVPRGEAVVVRQMLTLSLVFDHRLVDGAPAARFLQMIKRSLKTRRCSLCICKAVEKRLLLKVTKVNIFSFR